MVTITSRPKPGDAYGRWKVIGTPSRHRKKVWCRCACGAEKEILYQHLLSGHSHSCGCLRRELARERRLALNSLKARHSREYVSWRSMVSRCYRAKDASYQKYGAKGVRVCDRWLGPRGFENFLTDMGARPEGHTLDRFPDRSGHYGPDNCRWATVVQQNRNQRSNRLIKFRGQTKPLAEWAELHDISRFVLRSRLADGWEMSRALMTPVKGDKSNDRS